MIKPTDALVLAARSEDDFFSLEVHTYEEDQDNLYVHHDIVLPTYPLCLEWLDFDSTSDEGKSGNFVAIGTFNPEIEIWNLDILDNVEPSITLGGEKKKDQSPKRPSQKKKKKNLLLPGSHTDAVLGLSWNRQHKKVLASASADKTVKLWDIQAQTCLHTFTHHADKVQSVQWNPIEASVLLTGGLDKTSAVFDVRNPAAVAYWRYDSDVESINWNLHSPNTFLVSDEKGNVYNHDVMKPGQFLWTLNAHSKAVTGLAIHPYYKDLVVTASTDKSLKFWDVTGGRPNCLHSLSMNNQKLFCLSFYKDSPNLLAVGTKDGLQIVNVSQYAAVRKRFNM
eukprot:TRINITY_DN4755_c0_g1_i1.p1 TRINITY_DN4755_c0_g1~~TRINITY_DN4755_c0_g1_i1.p1  ORF type:complete len:337 (-),score=54.07 TRINITY_DN4755_c0_g1_i1:202-1212(-)